MSFSFDTPTPKVDATADQRAQQEAANKEILEKMKEDSKTKLQAKGARLRFFWTVRGQLVMSMVGSAIGMYFLVYPFFRETFKEMFGYNRTTEPAAQILPSLGVAWWQNQWRKGVQQWRRDEAVDGFWEMPCNWLASVTGKDIREPFSAFGYDRSKASYSVKVGQAWNEKEAAHRLEQREKVWNYDLKVADKLNEFKERQRKGFEEDIADMANVRKSVTEVDKFATPEDQAPQLEIRRESKFKDDTSRPRALVPLCGDSPMVRQLAEFGFNVDGVDAVELAIELHVQQTEEKWGGWNEDPMHRIQLHYSDIFEPALWRILPKHGYDLIWDRQALTAIDPEAREDYAFVLKRALKPGGVMYVEGIHRTKRVYRNRTGGPPFHMGERELRKLFPLEEGYVVKCEKMREVQRSDLSAEDRVVGQIPKNLWARGFPCGIWRDEDAAKRELERLRTEHSF